MRRFGQFLAGLGLALGVAVGLATMWPSHLVGLSWLLAVGMVKLGFVSALGLIAGGAVLQRIANRAEAREQLPPPRA
ncbi:MAG: hypothetical protein ACREN6_00780 [Gemmatimonadaceae bacterium]